MTVRLSDVHCVSMLMRAATEADGPPPTSMIILLVVLVTGGIIYTFGYLRAVMHRANKDYKTTKAAVPPLRKGFWAAWWSAVKIGFWVVVGIAVLVFWTGSDLRNDGDQQPTPAKVTPAVKKSK